MGSHQSIVALCIARRSPAKNKLKKTHQCVPVYCAKWLCLAVVDGCVSTRAGWFKTDFQGIHWRMPKKLRRVWVDGGYRGLKLMKWVAQRFHIVLQTIFRSDDAKWFQLLPRRRVVDLIQFRFYSHRHDKPDAWKA